MIIQICNAFASIQIFQTLRWKQNLWTGLDENRHPSVSHTQPKNTNLARATSFNIHTANKH